MNDIDVPVHSTATLIKASLVALLIAGIVFVIAILPAEYNIDPTGLGNIMGLTKFADAAANLDESAAYTGNIERASQSMAERNDTVEITIPAGKGLEYKLLMDKYAHVEYEWHTAGPELYVDFHGEPKGDTTGYYESFSITTTNTMKGSLTTPYAGSHGWYWKNTTAAPIVVTLLTKGTYIVKPEA